MTNILPSSEQVNTDLIYGLNGLLAEVPGTQTGAETPGSHAGLEPGVRTDVKPSQIDICYIRSTLERLCVFLPMSV